VLVLWSAQFAVLLLSTSQVLKYYFSDLYLGNLKDIVLTYIGFIFFDDTILTMMVATGLVLSFMGAGSYAVDSYLKER